MASLRQSTADLANIGMSKGSAPESFRSLDRSDFWGRQANFDETECEEIARLLLPINWLCDLLEHMNRVPIEANEHRAVCQELMDRLLAGSRSPELRDALIDAGVWIAARRYGPAATTLRAIAT